MASDISIDTQQDGSTFTLTVVGDVNTKTAAELDAAIAACAGMEYLILDFGGVQYIASSGLRVVVKADNALDKEGGVVIRNATELVREVFVLTGCSELLEQ